MSNLVEIKKYLETVFNEKQAEVLAIVIAKSYEELVKVHDFKELKDVVKDLAHAQERTEKRVEELAEAQKRTEQKIEELAEVQKRTECRVENLETKVDNLGTKFDKLETKVDNFGTKFDKLETRVDNLESKMCAGFKRLSDQITALGSRWGIYNESTFRSAIKGILEKQEGVTITRGFYGGREVDLIIRNGEHILLEITSRMKFSDIEKIFASGDDYKDKHGVDPLLMVATSYISPKLMHKIADLHRKIEIFSYEGEEEEG
jgi:hypothetical protein